jgi:hypothetical protein
VSSTTSALAGPRHPVRPRGSLPGTGAKMTRAVAQGLSRAAVPSTSPGCAREGCTDEADERVLAGPGGARARAGRHRDGEHDGIRHRCRPGQAREVQAQELTEKPRQPRVSLASSSARGRRFVGDEHLLQGRAGCEERDGYGSREQSAELASDHVAAPADPVTGGRGPATHVADAETGASGDDRRERRLGDRRADGRGTQHAAEARWWVRAAVATTRRPRARRTRSSRRASTAPRGAPRPGGRPR